MAIRYTKICKIHQDSQKPQDISASFWPFRGAFDIILKKVAPQWQSNVTSGYKRLGRDYKLDLSDMVLMLLLY